MYSVVGNHLYIRASELGQVVDKVQGSNPTGGTVVVQLQKLAPGGGGGLLQGKAVRRDVDHVTL